MRDFFNPLNIVVICVFLIVVTFVIGTYIDSKTNKDKAESGCVDICNSNSLNYYKVTSSGFKHSINTCYCKDFDGAISTWQM